MENSNHSNQITIYTSIESLVNISKGYFTLFKDDIKKSDYLNKDVIFKFFIPYGFIEPNQQIRPSKIEITQSVVHVIEYRNPESNVVALTLLFQF